MNPLKTFQDLQYIRPDFGELKAFYEDINARVKAAQSYDEVKTCILKEEEISSHFNTMAVIVQVRHTVDTSDKFYEQEDEYINQNYPELMPYVQGFNLALLSSPFKADIDREYGEQFLKAVKLGADSFSDKNIALLQEENDLVNRIKALIFSISLSLQVRTCIILVSVVPLHCKIHFLLKTNLRDFVS